MYCTLQDDTPVEEFIPPENAFGWVASTRKNNVSFHFKCIL